MLLRCPLSRARLSSREAFLASRLNGRATAALLLAHTFSERPAHAAEEAGAASWLKLPSLPALPSTLPTLPKIDVEGMKAEAARLWKLITTGSDYDAYYDVRTPEGAKAMGMAYPIPQDATDNWQLYLTFVALLLFLVAYATIIVPKFMERQDGTRTTLFATEEKSKEDEELREALGSLGQAPILLKKAAAVEDDLDLPKVVPASKARTTGFADQKEGKSKEPSNSKAPKRKR